MPPTASIAWLDWGADAFARAAAAQRPILLFVGTAWCRWTAEMDRFSFRDARVAHLVAERFLAVRVDAERRPDVSARYTLDGWPTTAFLTPGGDLLGGGTFFDADALATVLADVAEAFAARRADIDARAADARAAGGKRDRRGDAAGRSGPDDAGGPGAGLDDDAGRWLRDLLLARFDETWAGFGDGPKRAETAALAAALLRCRRTRDPDLTRVVTRTLDALAGGGLWDAAEGGFFRYCAGRDWSEPAHEKLLAPNARLLDLFLTASTLLDRADYAEHARALVRFAHGTFADPAGGFFASRRGAPGPDRPGPPPGAVDRTVHTDATAVMASAYDGPDRPGSPPGAVDRTVHTDATAVMASAYVRAASVFDDRSLLEFAAESIDRVMTATYERGAGVGHTATDLPGPRGLLADQVLAGAALLDLYEATGQPVYLDLPRELMAYCRRALWDDAGGFADRDPTLRGPDAPVGLLREPVYPLDLNCRAAMVLARLAGLAEEPGLLDLARRTLRRQTPAYRSLGLDGAVYLLALDAVSAAARR